jgi:hypothetical protein
LILTYEKWLVLPIVLHFMMLAVLGGFMGRARFRGVSSGRVKRSGIVNNSKNWPDDILKFGNNFDNQFQLPVYWHICTVLILVTGITDWMLVWLSWVFLVSRVVHTVEHVGKNTLPRRFYFYLAGFAALLAMWLWFAARYFVTG